MGVGVGEELRQGQGPEASLLQLIGQSWKLQGDGAQRRYRCADEGPASQELLGTQRGPNVGLELRGQV